MALAVPYVYQILDVFRIVKSLFERCLQWRKWVVKTPGEAVDFKFAVDVVQPDDVNYPIRVFPLDLDLE